jgi:ketosteroid isomerase-like protein
MPWFPDFANAMELARAQTRAAGQADPVRQYFSALNSGDSRDLETVWPGEVVVYDPRLGEIRGHKQLRQFIRTSQNWLAERHARTETMAVTTANGRAVVELLAHLSIDGRDVDWPVAVVAESRDDRSVMFRTYGSLLPIEGQRSVRPVILTAAFPPEPAIAPEPAFPPEPALAAAPVHAGDVVGRYFAAVEAGDVEAAVRTFEADGYVRDPAGPQAIHRGAAELRSFFAAQFSAGGIGLQQCAQTDDGVRCAVEYNCVRWGTRDLPPQPGLGVYERATDGLLAAARSYDDIEPPDALLDD